jgi:hypothetical protein
MKKWLKIILPLFLLCLLIPIKAGIGAFGVNINDTYTYECIAAERSFALGAESGIGEGFKIDGQHFDPGTTITVIVQNLISDSVVYNVSSGGYTYFAISDLMGFLISLRFYYLFYPFTATSIVTDVNNWNQTFVEEDPGLMLIEPFIEIGDATWTDFEEFADGMTTLVATANDLTGIIISSEFVQDDTTFLCEFHISGEFNETYTPVTSPSLPWIKDLNSLEHYYRFAYDKPTGVMLGTKMYGSASGEVNGSVMELSYDFHVEQTGYDLPDELTTAKFNGFSIMITIVTLSIPVILMKFKRKSIN